VALDNISLADNHRHALRGEYLYSQVDHDAGSESEMFSRSIVFELRESFVIFCDFNRRLDTQLSFPGINVPGGH
jgi:hypothetical protein